jgi:hypothetical protein
MKNKFYIIIAAILFFLVVPTINYAGSWNFSSGPEYGVNTESKNSLKRNYIKFNVGYETQLTEMFAGELQGSYSYQMAPYNSESVSFKPLLHGYLYKGNKMDFGIYGGPGLTKIISGYSDSQPDITGELNFTLTLGLETYLEICDNKELGFRIGIDHASNAGTGPWNTGRNGIFGMMVLKVGKR